MMPPREPANDRGVGEIAKGQKRSNIEKLDVGRVIAPILVPFRAPAPPVVQAIDYARMRRMRRERNGDVVEVPAIARQTWKAQKRAAV